MVRQENEFFVTSCGLCVVKHKITACGLHNCTGSDKCSNVSNMKSTLHDSGFKRKSASLMLVT